MYDVVIAGGGYAGVWAALGAARQFELAGRTGRIALIAREPYLTARPRLYEHGLAAADRCLPLGPILDAVGVAPIAGEVRAVDAPARRVILADGRMVAGEAVILALGSQAVPPAIPGLAAHAEGVDDAAQAARLWQRLAELEAGAPAVAVIGGGFTGIELAMELAGWRAARAPGARIHLIDRDRIAAGYDGPARAVILQALADFGVERHEGAAVRAVEPAGVVLDDGRMVAADVAVWAGGLVPHPLARTLPGETDAAGRVLVDHALRLPAAPGLFAAGDIAAAPLGAAQRTVMSCQHALSTGAFAGHNAARLVLGEAPLPFAPRPYVTCLDLGPAGALLTEGFERRLALQGAPAKALKRSINGQLIVPPVAGGRAALLDAASPARWAGR